MKKPAAILTMILMLVLALPALPAGASDEVEVTLSVVVKIDPAFASDLPGIAAAEEATMASALLVSRGLYLVEGSASVDIDKVEEKTLKAAKKLAHELAHDDRVVWAEPLWEATTEDHRFHAWPESDPLAAEAVDLADQEAFATLGLSDAWSLASGAGVTVAVLDTGFDTGHPLLSSRVLPGYDMIDDDADPSDDMNGIDDDGDGNVDEAFGHGTFVAGVVAQVAPDAKILPIRVLDADGVGALHTVVEGIDFAVASGADVINMSFGLIRKSDSKALKQALKDARKAGVVVVAAAGNHGVDDKRYPAATKDVVSVTAADRHGAALAHFAGRGKWVDVAAPGEGIVSAMPGGGYAEWDGSSMAAPVVAAQVALLAEMRPDDDANKLEHLIWKSARKTEHSGELDHGIVHILDACLEAS